ncbi:hypothetical protein, partial [uncultured Victivallis sp.]|uniref:hypothetical protein n=1 Tax=uncultured Victivallis sp. TaxID=354118 RepID=UPI0025F8311F
KNRFFTAFLKKSRTGCVKMGLAHEKKSYLQEKANLFEIGSIIYDTPERISHAVTFSSDIRAGAPRRLLCRGGESALQPGI